MMNIIKLKTLLTLGFILFYGSNVMASDESFLTSDMHMDIESNLSSSKALLDRETGFGGTSIRYLSLAASAMNNVSDSAYSYNSGGCILAGGTSLTLEHPVDLPHGSRIVSVTFMVNDDNENQSTRGMLYENFNGNSIIVTTLTSTTDTPGFTTHGAFLDFTISDIELLVMARLGITGVMDTAEVCGLRIGYLTPDIADEVIFASNFFR